LGEAYVVLEDKAKKRNQLAHFKLYQKAITLVPGAPIDMEKLEQGIDWYLSPLGFDGALQW
jgi:hypothetical protein